MVMVTDYNGVERFYMNKLTYKVMQGYRNKITDPKYNTLVYGIIVGKKGSGKSLLAQKLAMIIDPTFENQPDRVAMNAEEFMAAIINNRRKAIIGDEGVSICFNRNAMTKEGREMAEFWQQARFTNNCVLLCVPNLINLDSVYLNKDDINFIVRVWETTDEKGDKIKGSYEIFLNWTDGKGPKQANKLIDYLFNQKRNKFSYKPNFAIRQEGDKTKAPEELWHPSGPEYLNKKDQILAKYDKTKNPKEVKVSREVISAIKKELIGKFIVKIKEKNPEFTDNDVGKLIGYSKRRVNSLKKLGLGGN